jgi:uncharacterized membrane protein YeaQ/YmgE (transglycosylase-associated protein family)
MTIIWFVLIGFFAGWMAGMLVKGGGFGVFGDIIVGILGALLGGYLFTFIGIYDTGSLFGRLAVATLGSIVLISALRVIKRA